MQYNHTQTGAIHYIIYAVAAVLALVVWLRLGDHGVAMAVSALLLLLAGVGWFFQSMTVRDEGDRLAICYSPLDIPVRRIPYCQIQSVEASRSSIIDGWGIHWVPGRGTTYNVWGFGCCELRVGKRLFRIGSDDVDNLVSLLNSKIGGAAG